MERFNEIIMFVLLFVKTYFFYKLVGCFATIRKHYLLSICAPVLLLFIVNIVIFNQDIVNISYALIGFLLIMLLFYEGKPIQRISCVFVLYPIVVSLNFIDSSFIDLIFTTTINDGRYSLFEVVRNLLITFFWYLMWHFFSSKIQEASHYLTTKLWILLDIICLTPMIATSVTIIYTDNEHLNQIIIIILASIITNLGVIYLIGQLAQNVRIGLENQNLKLEQQYYQELEKSQTEIRKLGHDMNNHIATISAYLMANDIQSANEYFELLQNTVVTTNRVFCKNSLINAVLNAKYNQIQKQAIDCFINISINQSINIMELDLCSLFANTLDNAIEAVLKIEEPSSRKIEVRALIDKGFFSYEIKNSYVHQIFYKDSFFISSKDDAERHGYGLRNVSDIVEKYQGTLKIDTDENVFRVLMIIPVTTIADL